MRLRYYQDTVLFFFLLFLFGVVNWLSFKTQLTPSHPLKVLHLKAQEDGGISGTSP